jgi:hypothetical protein
MIKKPTIKVAKKAVKPQAVIAKVKSALKQHKPMMIAIATKKGKK